MGKSRQKTNTVTEVTYQFSEDHQRQIIRELGRNPNNLEWVILSNHWNLRFVREITEPFFNNLYKADRLEIIPTYHDLSFYKMSDKSSIGINLVTSYGIKKHNVFKEVIEGIYRMNNKLSVIGSAMTAFYCLMGIGKKNMKLNSHSNKNFINEIKGCLKGLKIEKYRFDYIFDDVFNDYQSTTILAVGTRKTDQITNVQRNLDGNTIFLITPQNGSRDNGNNHNLGTITGNLINRQYVEEISFIGKAGLIETVVQLAIKNKRGISLNIDKIPFFDHRRKLENLVLFPEKAGILVVISKGFSDEIQKLCRDQEVIINEIGCMENNDNFSIVQNKRNIASIPVSLFTLETGHPLENIITNKQSKQINKRELDISSLPIPEDFNSVLLKLIGSENIVKQNDFFIPSDNNMDLDRRENRSSKNFMVAIENNNRYTVLDPKTGATSSILGAIRRIISRGADPIGVAFSAVTGNLTEENNYLLFKEFMEGIMDVSDSMNVPLLHREINPQYSLVQKVIFVGSALGILENPYFEITPEFKSIGDFILILGSHRGELGGTEYLEQIHNLINGTPPVVDLSGEKRIHEILSVANKGGLIKSAAPMSAGGLAVILAKSVIRSNRQFGVRVHLSSKIRDDELLFGETQGLFIITVDEDNIIEIERLCMRLGVSCTAIGRVTDTGLFTINKLISLKVDTLRKPYLSTKKKIFQT